MSGRRSAALALLAALVAGAIVASGYGLRDGVLTALLLLALGAPALALAHVARARRARLGSPRRQLALGLAIGVGQLAVALGAAVALMFVSAHDAVVVVAVTAFAAVVAVRSVQLMGRGVTDDAERMRRDLVAAVSHDLRTPITSLRLLTEAIADDVVDEPTRRSYLAQMGTHVNALSALIDDLFELSRLEAGDIAWSLEQVRLDELVGETVDAMRVQADARNVRVSAELPGGSRVRPRRSGEAPARPVQPDPERDPAHARRRHRRRAGRVGGRRGGDRGGRLRRRDRGAGARAGLRAVLPRRRAGRPPGRRRRPRPGHLAGDRRGARRPDLARGRSARDASTLLVAGGLRPVMFGI